jgi:hypothetical protein
LDTAETTGEIDFRPQFEAGIVQIALIPGLEPWLVVPAVRSPECCGVVLQSFGWGNVPSEEPYSFEELIHDTVHTLKKPVIITSQFPAHSTLGSAYEPGRRAVRAGAIPTGNMTSAAATAKFRWVLAQVKKEIESGTCDPSERMDDISRRMQHNYVEQAKTAVLATSKRKACDIDANLPSRDQGPRGPLFVDTPDAGRSAGQPP